MAFHDKIRNLRLEQNLSQQDIADYLGVTKQAYSLYELGKRNVDNETLLKLSEYFHVSIDYLLGKTNIRSLKNANEQEESIRFALWGGDSDIVDDEMMEDVRDFAKLLIKKKKRRMRNGQDKQT